MVVDKEAKKLADKKADEALLQNAISLMTGEDKIIGEKLHQIIMKTAPDLMQRTWYGMPAYSNGSKIVAFFRPGKRFAEPFVTLGFNNTADWNKGDIWVTNYGITKISPEVEAEIIALIKKATS
jgi:hypothetical protein